jgi:hypothetical protein
MGRPIGGVRPGASGELHVDTTVDSVGPYALIMRRPGAQWSTRPAVHASPPTITVRKSGRPVRGTRSGTVASATGGISACVTRPRASTSANCSPSSGPGGGTTRAAPAGNDMHSSSTEASKLGEENSSTRSPGRTSKWSTSDAEKLASPACETTTPLGRPVEPEV